MRVFESLRAWRALVVVVATLAPGSARAHPGSGIVVDRHGQVYFMDTGSGLWKIGTDGALVRLATPRFHWMTLDQADAFVNTTLPSGAAGDVTRVGATPTLMLASDWPLAVGSDGNLYYPLRTGSASLDVLRVAPSGRRGLLVKLPLEYVNGLAAAPGGSLYYTENRALRRIDPKGRVSTIAERVSLATCPHIPGNDPNDPFLRGLAVDSAGTAYVAASGCGSVIKISRDGRITTILQLESPWSPTAVALFGDTIYVLEYLHTAVEDRLAWLPRVRRITPDGRSAIIASVKR